MFKNKIINSVCGCGVSRQLMFEDKTMFKNKIIKSVCGCGVSRQLMFEDKTINV